MVKPGYKETEVGVIPVDWEIHTLSEIGNFKNGINKNKEDFGFGVPFVNLMDVFGLSQLDSVHALGLVNANSSEQNMYCLLKGDVLFVRSSVKPSGVGLTTVVKKDLPKTVFSGFLLRYRSSLIHTNYKRYIFYADYFRTALINASTVSANTNISQQSLKQLYVIFPHDESEQQKIAEALSDMDELIASLEKLIAKKKAIKQGAMQELLTGKKRLLGFNGEWKNVGFDDIFTFIPNNAFTRAEMSESGSVKNIHYGDILTKFGAYIEASDSNIPYISNNVDISRFTDKNYLRSGDVIIADTAEDETVGKAVEVINVNCKMLAGQHTLLCRPQVLFAPKFLGYYLNAACYHNQLLAYIVGTKVSSVSKASVSSTKLFVPGYEEQQAISSILSDMDAEIKALEQKLAKCRQTKQGMMQQLLTGKIRLV